MSLLLTPLSIGKLHLNNRLVLPPMATAKSTSDGMVSESLCQYYDEKSKGGYIGLIITEHSYISPEGKASNGQLSIASDKSIDGLRKLTDIIHKNNSKVIAQVNHAGGAAASEITGCPTFSASSYTNPRYENNTAKEMSLHDIDKVIADFTNAAKRAKEAGFDGAEIHSAHGYLLNQFYSPFRNRRTDEYSGFTLEGRIRLHLQIINAVRQAVGDDFIIALRLGACDYMEGCTTIEDSVKAAILFEKAGLDLLDISGGFCGYNNPKVKEEGYFKDITAAIKQAVQIPVILTGGIVTASAAENLLKENCADMIGVGRAILADSDWAKRAVNSLM